MTSFRFPSVLFALGLFAATPAAATLRIVATTPDLADHARQIGGSLVTVDCLTKGTEDIHAVPQRPSFIPKLNRADGVVRLGFDAEHAFLPALLDAASNPKIMTGAAGDIDASAHITPLDVPATLSRTEGEQHPRGNPHYNIDPRKGAAVARAISEGFTRLDPANAAAYEKNRAAFESELSRRLTEWQARVAPLKGLKAISYHRDMVYFADFAGLELRGEIEPKPGIAPTPRHLEELVGMIKSESIPVIIREVQYSEKTPRWLAGQTGARVATVAVLGGAFPDTATYFGMIDHNVKALLEAVPAGAGK
jgi:ABC-type Zn uptake system ZnuABC Zn-binding protein ZnuA